ncbi:hypothetical protein HMPREF9072_02175, partial [Capnocytophaga sp. oral taxon 324 str. F0483]
PPSLQPFFIKNLFIILSFFFVIFRTPQPSNLLIFSFPNLLIFFLPVWLAPLARILS